MIKVSKQHHTNYNAQVIPVLFAGAELGAAILIASVAQFKDLMNEKGRQVERKKIVRQMLLTVTEVMFEMVALIFQGIKRLVFNFPAGTAGFD